MQKIEYCSQNNVVHKIFVKINKLYMNYSQTETLNK